jgi:hypothetical protein
MPERPEEVRTGPARHSTGEWLLERRTSNIERPILNEESLRSFNRLKKSPVVEAVGEIRFARIKKDRMPYSKFEVGRSMFMGLDFSPPRRWLHQITR